MVFSKKTVALKYDFKGQDAPRVIAKGFGRNGVFMEKLAESNGIPIKKNQALAKALYQLPVLSEIPEELYEILTTIYLSLAKADEILKER